MSEDLKREAAARALTEVTPGMRLGLGTGSTARHFVDLLGARVAEGLEVICVPTSEVTAAQARDLDIPLSDLDTLDWLDLTVDGADELDRALNLIKGGGGALLREKIVAASSERMIVIADGSKLVDTLGALSAAHRGQPLRPRRHPPRPRSRSGNPWAEGGLRIRATAAGEPFVTDGGHLILDALFGRISQPEALSDDLLAVPGVVQHGLFLGMCSKAYVATPNGVEEFSRGN